MKNDIVSGSGIDRLIDDFIGIVLPIPFCPLPCCPRTHPGVGMYGNYAKKINLLLAMQFSAVTDVFLLKLHIIAFRSISIRPISLSIKIYIAPLQVTYSEALPTQGQAEKNSL